MSSLLANALTAPVSIYKHLGAQKNPETIQKKSFPSLNMTIIASLIQKNNFSLKNYQM